MLFSGHQPAYLPWLGYFDKLVRCDAFMFLDTVQFERDSFIHRNKIKTCQGPLWLTVPIHIAGHIETPLNKIKIANQTDWKAKHLKTIAHTYGKSPRFASCFPKLEALYSKDYSLLSDLCFDHLLFWMREIGIERKLIRTSELPPMPGKKEDLILNLLKHLKASSFLAGSMGRDYLSVERWADAGIRLEFQDYQHPRYRQLYGDFIPGMSILDVWMNVNPSEVLMKNHP